MKAGFADRSATIPISLGPAGKSISRVLPQQHLRGRHVDAFPGPTIFRHGRMLSVPSAIAAIACAPPIR